MRVEGGRVAVGGARYRVEAREVERTHAGKGKPIRYLQRGLPNR